ncbi:MAG: histone deacetylase [Chitinispirillaceae bacterium]|nr:histone deacetylase [Chitinispirillaceae bacterium]
MHTALRRRDIFLSFMTLKTGFFFNESFLQHELEPGHPESPERLVAIVDRIAGSDAADRFFRFETSFDAAVHAPLITAVHSEAHFRDVIAIPATGRAAGDAVAAVIDAVDAVVAGKIANAFCAVRPPGHHAHNSAHRDGINQGEGFCFFNNVAIAARYVQRRYHAARILIVDWDFHHGNGTESCFYDDPSVFYFSTHRLGAYPGTGLPTRTGSGAGRGATLNFPLPRPEHPFGPVDDNDLLMALRFLVDHLDAISFAPDFLLISAGFDGLECDLLGNFSLSESVFYPATQLCMEIAARSCNGRIVSTLEGGYDPSGIALAVETHMKALARFPDDRAPPERAAR